MKKFEAPVICKVDDLAEGIYAASGAVVNDPIPVITETGDWKFDVKWCNHNSGSHSEMEVHGHNYGKQGGSHIEVTLAFFGRGKIISCANASKATQTEWSSNSIKLVYDGVFNPGEDVVFGLPDVRFSESPAQYSYHLSGQNCNCPANDAFMITGVICK
ncbi:MAG: hypothetical protein K6F84_02890 [Lachnospiraceae bacterium]|nr:hypothetical protein [Lachnospiraceae bacterium]